jgi:HEAT repeat protein
MTGRGADIFQECRTALISVGEPAVDPLIEAMQRKNADLEADAKKYEFLPGIIVQKTAYVLGDLRAKRAVAPLVAELGKKDEGLAAGEGKGVSGHQSVILALGSIGGPEATKAVLGVLNDGRAKQKLRAAACEAMNALGEKSALPSLAKLAQTKFINEKSKEIDPDAAGLVAGAATAYSRIADETAPAASWQKLPAELEDSDVGMAFRNAATRLVVAKECKKDLGCYTKALGDKDNVKAEKAAIMLVRFGKPGLGELCKNIGHPDPAVRMTVLWGVGHLGDKSAKDCSDALEKQIEKDKGKTGPIKGLTDEERAVHAQLMH